MIYPLMGATALATTAAALAGYQSMAPTGQWYGRTFIGLRPDSRQLALTYDDGPNDPHTLKLLDVLAKHDVRVTFFLLGRYVDKRPDIVSEIVRAGHIVGNHTYTHPNLIFCSTAQTRIQIQDCARAIKDAVGDHSRLFRPPFGGRRPSTLRVAQSLGLAPVMWNVTGWDWNAPPADRIVEKVTANIRGGDIILLHDGGELELGADRSQTVIATDRLITRYKAEGYEFATVTEMMGDTIGSRRSITTQNG
jgi:peptidoglycan-N-acetylglucosamine deacetylase